MTNSFVRLLGASALAALAAGCAVVPGDPYYQPSASYPAYPQQPSYGYGTPPVYSTPSVIYPSAPPPAVYYGGGGRSERERWEYERERERQRAESDRADRQRAEQARRDQFQRDRDREQQARDRDRDRQARERDQQARDRDQARRDQARRDQAERERRAVQDRNDRPSRPNAGYGNMPGPNDWRARQYSNTNPEPGAGP